MLFRSVPSASQSPFSDLAFTNTGTGNLILTGTALSGLDAAQFVLQDTNTYPLTLAHGDSAHVKVAFKPAAPGSRVANVYVSINAGNQQVPLHGTGGFFTGSGEPGINAITFHPNPASGAVMLTCLSGGEMLRLVDLTGRILLEDHCLACGSHLFSLPGISPGLYLLLIDAPDGSSRALRLVCQ